MFRARPSHGSRPRGTPGIPPPVPGGLASAAGLAAGALTALLVGLSGWRGHPVLTLAALGGVAVAVAVTTTAAGAAAAAVQCWGLWDGFLVNRFGELTATAPGLTGLLGLTAGAVLASLAASLWRRQGRPRWAIGAAVAPGGR